jgi:hypothetical protein
MFYKDLTSFLGFSMENLFFGLTLRVSLNWTRLEDCPVRDLVGRLRSAAAKPTVAALDHHPNRLRPEFMGPEGVIVPCGYPVLSPGGYR